MAPSPMSIFQTRIRYWRWSVRTTLWANLSRMRETKGIATESLPRSQAFDTLLRII